MKNNEQPFLDELIHKEPDFLDTSSEDVSDDEILEYLAKIIAEIYLDENKKEGN